KRMLLHPAATTMRAIMHSMLMRWCSGVGVLNFFIISLYMATAYECCDPRRRHGKADAIGAAESAASSGRQAPAATRHRYRARAFTRPIMRDLRARRRSGAGN